MTMRTMSPIGRRKRIVLIGGGHTHVVLLRDDGRNFSGVDVLLVSENQFTFYSSMIAGVLAGLCSSTASMIDLKALCEGQNVGFRQGRAVGIDFANLLHGCVELDHPAHGEDRNIYRDDDLDGGDKAVDGCEV